MSFWDVFSNINLSNIGNMLGIKNNEDAKLRYKIESLKTPSMPIVTIERKTHINQVLNPLNGVKTGKPVVASCKTMAPEHGHAWSRFGVKARHVEAFEVRYKGLLAQHGAPTLYAVVGYGDNNNWQSVQHIPMTKLGHKSFSACVPMDDEFINIAFHDGCGGWDNNSGSNYTYIKKLLKSISQSDKKE